MQAEKKSRQDSWSFEDDQLLANTVYNHIREGSTQLLAFKEVAELLNRTSAACGFRWNSTIRKQYDQEIKNAKEERKKNKSIKRKGLENSEVHQVQVKANPSSSDSNLQAFYGGNMSFEDIMKFLGQKVEEYRRLEKELILKDQIIRELQDEIRHLRKELDNKVTQPPSELVEDYQTLIQILDRARQMSILPT
ncbi:RsfA family transcriptional regulator [Ammoniphilus sp. 3BR4]|uniref:RsfA family transcriptional regulator n=1 Tax=Ammoniphilus sp. 3BR4 TaxID=3158265 RepID=UPI003465E6B0